MLYLTRGKGEKIVLNDGEIIIQLMRCEYGRALIGVEADRHVSIDREEIFQKKREKMIKAKMLNETMAIRGYRK